MKSFPPLHTTFFIEAMKFFVHGDLSLVDVSTEFVFPAFDEGGSSQPSCGLFSLSLFFAFSVLFSLPRELMYDRYSSVQKANIV